MSIQLQPETQKLIDTLLYDDDKAKRNVALGEIVTQPDTDQVEKYILERLDSEKDRWRLTWSLSILAEIGLPDGKKEVLTHISEKSEDDPWVRHFALINAANFSPFPVKEFESATKDSDVLPKATALRLLLAEGKDQYSEELLDMLSDVTFPDARWAAARALRNRIEIKMKPLRDHIEGEFLEPLVDIAKDPNVYLDTRWEAIQTLASFQKRKGLAAAQLGELLIEDRDQTLRRFYLEALMKIDQPHESQSAMLVAIEDADAQIRLDAANAIKKWFGEEKSIQLLMPRALDESHDPSLIVDALRHIDPDTAAKEIRDKLNNPDSAVSARANLLLTELGGQAAAQILMNERAKALDNYTHILTDADKDVREHFKELMSQAKIAFWLSLIMHVVVFGIGAWVLVASLSLALSGGLNTVSTWIGVGGAGAGAVAILLSTFYRSPLKNVRGSLNALMQVDVVF